MGEGWEHGWVTTQRLLAFLSLHPALLIPAKKHSDGTAQIWLSPVSNSTITETLPKYNHHCNCFSMKKQLFLLTPPHTQSARTQAPVTNPWTPPRVSPVENYHFNAVRLPLKCIFSSSRFELNVFKKKTPNAFFQEQALCPKACGELEAWVPWSSLVSRFNLSWRRASVVLSLCPWGSLGGHPWTQLSTRGSGLWWCLVPTVWKRPF